MTGDNQRFIIVGTGRSGSSLLAAILADSGADFAMMSQKKWERDSGAFEHRNLVWAYNWHNRANLLSNFPVPFRMIEFCRRKCRANLQKVFTSAMFAKYPAASRIVHEIEKVGFHPTVIVSVRSFGSYAISMYRRRGSSMNELIEDYVDTYQTALLQLRLYGGCVVDYADMVDTEATRWIDALSGVTQISAEKISEARKNRVAKVRTAEETPAYWDAMMQMDDRPKQIYDILQSLNGQIITTK